MGSTKPTLIINPIRDREFARFANAQLDAAASTDDLQTLLRTRYPNAAVHARELAGERILVWYVYRDGHWIRSSRDDRWRRRGGRGWRTPKRICA
jgi:hypothetical protein